MLNVLFALDVISPEGWSIRPHWDLCSIHLQTSLSEGNTYPLGEAWREGMMMGEKWQDYEVSFCEIQLLSFDTMDGAKILHLYWFSKVLISLFSGIIALGIFHRTTGHSYIRVIVFLPLFPDGWAKPQNHVYASVIFQLGSSFTQLFLRLPFQLLECTFRPQMPGEL